MGAIIARLAAPDKAFGDCLFLRSITTLVHPSRCEGSWFLLAALALRVLPLQANTKVPRFTRDDNSG
jgi:hypothetical protein